MPIVCYEINSVKNTFLSPSLSLSQLLSSVYIFSFIYLFIYFLLVECQPTCFKTSSYIFSKSGRGWSFNGLFCSSQGGDLVSIETEEEWQFISDEIQKRGTWKTSAWQIGLKKYRVRTSSRQRDWVWVWNSGKQLNISKWRDSEPNGKDYFAEISKNESLFNGIARNDTRNAYICEMQGGKITFQP